jgi:hypothetical protein
MLPIITSQLKDSTLHWLCHNVPLGQLEQIDVDSLLEATNADLYTISAILEDFNEIGLFEKLILNSEDIFVVLKARAHDLLNRGGFSVIDALNEANIQRILFELDNLKKQLKPDKPDQLEILNKITTIAASLTTVLAAFSAKG